MGKTTTFVLDKRSSHRIIESRAADYERLTRKSVGDKQYLVDSARFQGDWVVLGGGYPALKAIWIPREQVSLIQEPK